jgi:hypothetical protein
MPLESTQPLTEISTRILSEGKGHPAHEADSLTAIYEPIAQKMCEPRRLTILWVSTACCKDNFCLKVANHWIYFCGLFSGADSTVSNGQIVDIWWTTQHVREDDRSLFQHTFP